MTSGDIVEIPAELSALQDYVRAKSRERGFDDESVAQKFMLLSEEVGELAKAARKLAGIKTASKEKTQAGEEAADVLFVLLNVCNKLDVKLAEAFRSKERKNDSRQWS